MTEAISVWRMEPHDVKSYADMSVATLEEKPLNYSVTPDWSREYVSGDLAQKMADYIVARKICKL